ncbi:hypothetical protein AAE478_009803 [Parahypoxylon ruwenzoriense]
MRTLSLLALLPLGLYYAGLAAAAPAPEPEPVASPIPVPPPPLPPAFAARAPLPRLSDGPNCTEIEEYCKHCGEDDFQCETNPNCEWCFEHGGFDHPPKSSSSSSSSSSSIKTRS